MNKTELQNILTWYSSGKLKDDEAIVHICALEKASNDDIHISQLILTIEDLLDPLHPVRHCSSFKRLKDIYKR